jgi:hypothetical protein
MHTANGNKLKTALQNISQTYAADVNSLGKNKIKFMFHISAKKIRTKLQYRDSWYNT